MSGEEFSLICRRHGNDLQRTGLQNRDLGRPVGGGNTGLHCGEAKEGFWFCFVWGGVCFVFFLVWKQIRSALAVLTGGEVVLFHGSLNQLEVGVSGGGRNQEGPMDYTAE